jgi:hypothetical protein
MAKPQNICPLMKNAGSTWWMTIPPAATTDPTTIAAQAAAVVPRFQYRPPMMTAPLPPAKIAPVMAKKRKMYSLCWNRRLKKKLKTATARMESFRSLRCRSGANGFFRSGITTSWMKMLPHEWR